MSFFLVINSFYFIFFTEQLDQLGKIAKAIYES